MIYTKRYEFENGKTLGTITKGDTFTMVECDTYDFSETNLILEALRVNKNTISVLCVGGYMKGSKFKVNRPTA